MGRPTKMTPETLDKLRQAFLIGATNDEACAFAEIHRDTLYDYMKKNPNYSYLVEQYKETPILKAKATVNKNLDDSKTAQWYLERRAKEFKPKQDLTTNDKDLPTPILNGIEGLNVQTDNGSEETAGTIEKN